MSICESEENRKKLAWLVPGYILLAWFFCVLFQPLGINSPTSRLINSKPVHSDKDYEVIYLLKKHKSDSQAELLNTTFTTCEINGSAIRLEKGANSAAIIRLSDHYDPYQSFNCSLRIEAGDGLDGVSAVIEEMDLREHHDDMRQPGGHWASSVCIDYIEAYTDKSRVRNKLCGHWTVEGDRKLTNHGPKQTLVGYCYDDQSGTSCEAKTIFINVVIDPLQGMKEHYGINIRNRRGFSIVVTGYRHLRPGEEGCEKKEEYQCPIKDFSLHDMKPHCIWRNLRCDSHQNCGFTYNADESECSNYNLSPWTVSTMTLLILIYIAVVVILVLVTMLLLRWHRTLRTPLEFGPTSSSSTAPDMLSSANMITTDLPDGSTMTEARTGHVSIIVSYRPTTALPKTVECPPSYDSLFLEEQPPNYNSVSSTSSNPRGAAMPMAGIHLPVNQTAQMNTDVDATPLLQRERDVGSEQLQQPSEQENVAEPCDCDCDHSQDFRNNN